MTKGEECVGVNSSPMTSLNFSLNNGVKALDCSETQVRFSSEDHERGKRNGKTDAEETALIS